MPIVTGGSRSVENDALALLVSLSDPEKAKKLIGQYKDAQAAAAEEQVKAAEALKQLDAIRADLTARENALYKAQEVLTAAQQEVAKRVAEVADATSALDAEKNAVIDYRDDLTARDKTLQDERKRLATFEAQLVSKSASLTEREVAVAAREIEVDAKIKAFKEAIGI